MSEVNNILYDSRESGRIVLLNFIQRYRGSRFEMRLCVGLDKFVKSFINKDILMYNSPEYARSIFRTSSFEGRKRTRPSYAYTIERATPLTAEDSTFDIEVAQNSDVEKKSSHVTQRKTGCSKVLTVKEKEAFRFH